MASEFTDLDYVPEDQSHYANVDVIQQADDGGEVRRERRKKKKHREGEEGGDGERRHHRRHRKKEEAEEGGEEGEAPVGENGERRKKRKHRRHRDEETPEPTEQLSEIPAQSYDENPYYNQQDFDQPQEPDFHAAPPPPVPDSNGHYNGHNDMEQPADEGVHQEEEFPAYEPEFVEDGQFPAYEPEFVGEHEGYHDENWQPQEGDGYSPHGQQLDDQMYSFNEGMQPPPPMPIPEPEKKKGGGGIGKLFSSFKLGKGKKAPSNDSDQGSKLSGSGQQSGIHDQWTSNPQIFNPNLDSQPGTLDRPQPRRGPMPQKKKSAAGGGIRPLAAAKARVVLLDGGEVELDVDKKVTGQQIMDRICSSLDIVERDYFGMTWVNKKVKTWFWLDLNKKVAKQLCHGEDWVFNLQVKFYPPEPSLLQEDITRYQLSLQIRQDIYTGKLPCSWVTQALLGSFMVQSEIGDYDETEFEGKLDYLNEFEFVHNQTDQLLIKVAELHKNHVGMTPDQADLKYLETSKRLEQYGVDLHPARDMEDIQIYLGVCFHGVVVYRDRLRIGRFAWPKVLRISYKKNFFYLKIRSDYYDDVEAMVGFKLFNHRMAKRLWKNAVEHHTFFRLKEGRMAAQVSILPTLGSKYRFSGRTYNQYRTMSIDRPRPDFERSLTKRRTASLPMGLNTTGLHYSSMHSLNRSHPRDMTLGKTQSVEYLGPRRYGSSSGSLNELNLAEQGAGRGGVVTRTNQAPFSGPIVRGGGGSDMGGSQQGRGSAMGGSQQGRGSDMGGQRGPPSVASSQRSGGGRPMPPNAQYGHPRSNSGTGSGMGYSNPPSTDPRYPSAGYAAEGEEEML